MCVRLGCCSCWLPCPSNTLPTDLEEDGIWDYQWCSELLCQETYFSFDSSPNMFWDSPFNMTFVNEHCQKKVRACVCVCVCVCPLARPDHVFATAPVCSVVTVLQYGITPRPYWILESYGTLADIARYASNIGTFSSLSCAVVSSLCVPLPAGITLLASQCSPTATTTRGQRVASPPR